jgi:ankyrin repeat protein
MWSSGDFAEVKPKDKLFIAHNGALNHPSRPWPAKTVVGNWTFTFTGPCGLTAQNNDDSDPALVFSNVDGLVCQLRQDRSLTSTFEQVSGAPLPAHIASLPTAPAPAPRGDCERVQPATEEHPEARTPWASAVETQLIKLVSSIGETGSPDPVRELIESGKAELGAIYRDWTALMMASRLGNDAVIELLAPWEARMVDSNGVTALRVAAGQGNLSVVKILAPYERGIASRIGSYALMGAAGNNRADVVEALLPFEGGAQDQDGDTALHYAVMRHSSQAAAVLAPREHGMKNQNQATALMIAADKGFVDLVQLLLPFEAGMTGLNGLTACMVATAADKVDVVRLLAPSEARLPTPHGSATNLAAGKNHVECLKILLEAGAVNMPDEDGDGPLHFAAGAGSMDAVRILLAYPELVTATNNSGMTPADVAEASQEPEAAAAIRAVM